MAGHPRQQDQLTTVVVTLAGEAQPAETLDDLGTIDTSVLGAPELEALDRRLETGTADGPAAS